jgi:hypothetical protein
MSRKPRVQRTPEEKWQIVLEGLKSGNIAETCRKFEIVFLAESKICWWKTGHLGVRFVSLSRECKSELQDWLSQKLEEMLPEFVARKFQKAESSSMTALVDRKQDKGAGKPSS